MNILITGGTGSLGQALTQELIKSNTWERICIYSRGEHKQEEMAKKFKSDKLRFFIGDVRDKDRLNRACIGMQTIVHAAALKIVPTAEYNPDEAIKTNILGAQNLIECAINNHHSGYPAVLALSTDKAVHPINLYGATKLCAEKLFIAANNIVGLHGPRFSVARYGNVANSNGSVIPLFKEQIKKGEQLTITDDRMTRFYITLPEAVNLIKYSLNNMVGGEIFAPDMPAFNVKDLALTMMRGYAPEKQWCRVIGIRPGEKLHEEIVTKEEMELSNYNKDSGIYTISSRFVKDSSIMSGYDGLTSDKAEQLTQLGIQEKLEQLT